MTPIQELIREFETCKNLATNPESKKWLEAAKGTLTQWLPKERQFAQNIFNAGRDREWSVRFGKVPPAEPSFEDYYKQFDL